MALITLTHPDVNGGDAVTIKCGSVTVSGKKTNQSKPDANGSDLTEVHTIAYENLKYAINNVYFTGEDGTLTWDDVIALYKARYDGTNEADLVIVYGTTDTLNGLSETAPINVVLETVSLNVDARDSKDAYRPTASLSFIETK